MLLEWVGKDPKAALHPSEAPSVPQQDPQLHPQHQTPLQIWHRCKQISAPREIGSTGMEYTCTNRAAPSIGIPKPQQVLLSSPQPGDGALGRLTLLRISWHWLGVLRDSSIPSQRTHRWGTKHGNKKLQDQQKEAHFCPTCSFIQCLNRPQGSCYRALFILGLIREGAQARLGCLTLRHCPKFWSAWQHFSSVTEAISPMLEMQN